MPEIVALVTGEERRNGKRSPFWQMDIKTAEGPYRAVIWDVQDSHSANLPHKGDLIVIDLSKEGVKDQRGTQYNNIILQIDSYNKVEKGAVDKEILDAIYNVPKASQAQLESAYKIITDKSIYRDVNNFTFVMAVFAALPKSQLFTCPAATSVHHAFQGGLIVHTAEVVKICRGVVAAFPFPHFIDQDVIFAGSTLHDVGKAITYGTDELGQPSSSILEKTVGHIYYGMSLIEQIGKERKVNKVFLDEVLHVIASHHGSPEFGAIKEPMTLEAIIVSQADYLGSRAGIIDSHLSPMKEHKTNVGDDFKAFGHRFVMSNAVKRWYSGV